ncbi:unnamed protein product [Candidula unifasciata]|uniref:USP domain-containing protein n=1 Tax=Candidula unifasciata TaxID=100452 RepID=A0A8S3YX91_9EUPU|nr:unnamed protein product [Candidula unifasciata]
MADSWIYTTLSYGGLEFVTFVLVDAVVKSPLRDAATDGEKRTIWLYESVGLSLICFLVYLLHHMPYLLILLTGITFVYTQLLSRTDLTNIVADLRAHWENHLQHEESMKQLEQQKYLQQQQQTLGMPNFPTPGINNLGGQNAEQNYGISFPFLTKQPALHYPPNATVVPGQDTPVYSLNPSIGLYRDGIRHSRGAYTSYNRSWNNVAATNYSAVDVQHALPAVTNAAYDSTVTTIQNTNSNGRQFLWSDQNLPRRSLHPNISTRALSKPSSTSSIKSKVMSMVGYGPTTLRPIGLVNYGQNVCFINSVVQCLARGPYLVENLTAIAAKELECTVFESQLLSSLTELLDHLTLPPDESQQKALSVNKFRLACSNLNPQLVTPPGQHMKQQDAAEFLMWLLAVLHGILNKNRRALDADSTDDCGFTSPRLASLKLIYGDLSPNRVQELRNQCRKDIAAANGLENESYAEAIQRLSDLEWLIYKQTNDTLIDSLFTGQLVEAYHDVNHGSISVNLQTFNVLPVPIDYPDSYSGLVMLDDCFARFCHVENISEASSNTVVMKSDQQVASGVLRNRNLHVKALGGSPTTPQNFRLSKEPDLACMLSPIHPSMYPGLSTANTFTPQTLPTSPPVQTFLRANPGNDSGFLDNTFKTSTPLGKDSAGSKLQEKIQRRCLLRQLPECLIIQLMRFRYDSLAQRPTKVTTAVSVRLRDFNLRDVIYDNVMHRGDLTVSDSKYVYELYGLCLHLGADSTSHGHYISYVQDRGHWYRMDDQNVVEVNMEFQLNSEEIRQNAYLLFYRRTV